MKLTKLAIEHAQLPPAGTKQRFLRDGTMRGLGVRITRDGARSFIFEYWLKGRSHRLTIGRWPDLNIPQARDKAAEFRAAIAQGRDPASEAAQARHEASFGQLTERYLNDYARPRKRPRSIADDEYYLRCYVPQGWKSRRLSDISHEDIARLHARLGQKHGRYPANHTFRLLRCMFNLALGWRMLTDDNPCKGLKPYREEKRDRYLSPDELQRVNEALLVESDWRWRAFFPLAVMLGVRKGELMSMRWTDIDLGQRTWRIPETKANKPHLLPLPAAVVSILESLPRKDDCEWVFPATGSVAGHIVNPAEAWGRIRDRAGVPDVRIHDLRHTLASWLVAQGFSLPLIAKTLNHQQTATAERYSHPALDPVRSALEQTAALMNLNPNGARPKV